MEYTLPKNVDITGNVFGRLTAIRRVQSPTRDQVWLFQCACGTTKEIMKASVTKGSTKSCGCLAHEIHVSLATKHGMSKTPEYCAWKHLNGRCNNPNNKAFKNYGGRGIRVYYSSFDEFLGDVGTRPSPKHSVDRINVNGHYEVGNCRWATPAQQVANRRCVRNITRNGVTKPLSIWSRQMGFDGGLLRSRIVDLGWTIDEAFSEPLKSPRDKRRGSSKLADLTGKRFGRLTVKKLVKKSPTHWECVCDCGTVKVVWAASLVHGTTKSCGCLRSELRTQKNFERHGRVVRISNRGASE